MIFFKKFSNYFNFIFMCLLLSSWEDKDKPNKNPSEKEKRIFVIQNWLLHLPMHIRTLNNLPIVQFVFCLIFDKKKSAGNLLTVSLNLTEMYSFFDGFNISFYLLSVFLSFYLHPFFLSFFLFFTFHFIFRISFNRHSFPWLLSFCFVFFMPFFIFLSFFLPFLFASFFIFYSFIYVSFFVTIFLRH